MQDKIRQFIKKWLPPALLELIRSRIYKKNKIVLWWEGNYSSWEEAMRVSTGWESPIILERAKQACLKIKRGEAVYERDSVTFNEIQYRWPLLAGLMWIAAQSEGKLNIIDFGGSFGSVYFQHKKFFDAIPDVKWNIVEQPHFVREGKKYFEDNILKFFHDIESCIDYCSPTAILFSSVVQYLENPFQFLEKVKSLGFWFILFDRTPFVDGDKDILTVQRVPPEIYPASYPCWFFSKKKFYAFFEDRYELIARFEALDKANIPNSTFEGCIFRRKDA